MKICTGWRKCTGCLKSQASFRKRATNYRALLRIRICTGWRRCIGCLGLQVSVRDVAGLSAKEPVTLSTALNLVHRNSFPKLSNFPAYCTQLCKSLGGGHFQKACRSRKKESKPSEITCKQSEPARTISQIQKRREFLRVLCYQ